jgi:hypothetical protein
VEKKGKNAYEWPGSSLWPEREKLALLVGSSLSVACACYVWPWLLNFAPGRSLFSSLRNFSISTAFKKNNHYFHRSLSCLLLDLLVENPIRLARCSDPFFYSGTFFFALIILAGAQYIT